jgi:hypothetical protein
VTIAMMNTGSVSGLVVVPTFISREQIVVVFVVTRSRFFLLQNEIMFFHVNISKLMLQ